MEFLVGLGTRNGKKEKMTKNMNVVENWDRTKTRPEWEKKLTKKIIDCLFLDRKMVGPAQELLALFKRELQAQKKELVGELKEEIGKRMEIEKHRAETHSTEREYKRGKYIGLRYAHDIVTGKFKKLEKK